MAFVTPVNQLAEVIPQEAKTMAQAYAAEAKAENAVFRSNWGAGSVLGLDRLGIRGLDIRSGEKYATEAVFKTNWGPSNVLGLDLLGIRGLDISVPGLDVPIVIVKKTS